MELIRSSQKAIGRSGFRRRRLRAKARLDWQRGPSVPSMFTGRPMTTPPAERLSMSLNRALASSVNLVLRINSSGVATVRVASLTATPIVFSPRSRPARGA